MDLLTCLSEYVQVIKETPYLYDVQIKGIRLFESFILSRYGNLEIEELDDKVVEEFLVIWLPRHKRYLTEVEAYDIVYTMQGIYLDVLSRNEKVEPIDSIVDLYAKEYMRLYRVKNLFNRVLEDPVMNMNPKLISLNAYAHRKEKKKESMCTYEQGFFQINKVCAEGYIVVEKIEQKREYKVLLEACLIKHLKAGDIIHARFKRKIFFVYWELDDVFHYYLDRAITYL